MASIVHYDPEKHFVQFRLIKESEVVNNIWYWVWVEVVGELWKQMNKKIFRDGVTDHSEIFTMVQLKVWSWLTADVKLTCFSYFDWCLESLVCKRSVINSSDKQ